MKQPLVFILQKGLNLTIKVRILPEKIWTMGHLSKKYPINQTHLKECKELGDK